MSFEPAAVLDRIVTETDRLLTTAAAFDDDDVCAPSLLPGWSRGHVLTHVARNGDGGRRLLTWARTGVEQREYDSLEARAAEIEAGAGRGAAELRADVRASADRFAEAYKAMPAEAWERVVRWTAGQEHPAARAADARLTEVLVHHVDLDAGYRPSDWPVDFVSDALAKVVASFARRPSVPIMRLWAQDTGIEYELGASDDALTLRGSQAALLAWLMGRSAGNDLDIPPGRELPTMPKLY